MTRLDPERIFDRLVNDLPADLHDHVFVVGSLAAAYHFRVELHQQGVNTKDADLVVHPAGDAVSCSSMAERLLELGWRPHPDCYPSSSPTPGDALRAIRLYPPESMDYFVEFLNLPEVGQVETKKWIPVEVQGGWFGLPTFRFQGLCAHSRLQSQHRLDYASPAAMALANLLSHPVIRRERMSLHIGGREILRSAKASAVCSPSPTSRRETTSRVGSSRGATVCGPASLRSGESWLRLRAPASASCSQMAMSSRRPCTHARSDSCEDGA